MSKAITNYNELTIRIAELNALKERQEAELKTNVKELYQTLQPKNLLKNTLRNLANDADFRQEGIKAATGMATDLIVGRLLNKNNSVKGYLLTYVVKELALPLIEKNKDKVLSFIKNLLLKPTKENE